MLVYLFSTYMQKLFDLGKPGIETRTMLAFVGFAETVAEFVLIIYLIIISFQKIKK